MRPSPLDFHFGRPGKAGPLAKTLLCAQAITGPCVSGRLQTAELSDAKALLRGTPMYVEVHTKKNPAGEIRGQIKVSS
jgi:CHRD domain